MILEFVIGTLAQVAISRYAEKGLSFVDDRVREVLADAADGSPEAVAEADVHLAVKFLEQPAQAAELLDLVFEPPFVREVTPGTQLKKYRSVVRGAFDVAHAMPGRRVAVPGWFTGTECAALLDARLGPNNGWSPELSGSSPDDAKPDELAQLDTQGEYLLFRNTSSAMSGKPPGVPRVLIIEAERDIPKSPWLRSAIPMPRPHSPITSTPSFKNAPVAQVPLGGGALGWILIGLRLRCLATRPSTPTRFATSSAYTSGGFA